MTSPRRADAFGQALVDWAEGGSEPEMIEREDGYLDVGAGREWYLSGFEEWPSPERQAMRYVRGRAIDLGCAAGRVALHLQRRDTQVVAADSSELALRTARRRGVRTTWKTTADDLVHDIERFDTVVLFGNNFGIFGTADHLRRTLSEWAAAAKPGTRILAESTDPYGGGAPAIDRAYCKRNRRLGGLPGEVKLRVRYRDLATPWFSWLFTSRTDMRKVLSGTGWHPKVVLAASAADPFVAVLEND